MAELIADQFSALVDRLQGIDEDSALLFGDDEMVHHISTTPWYIM